MIVTLWDQAYPEPIGVIGSHLTAWSHNLC